MRATARLIQGCTLAALMVAATVLPGSAAAAAPRELNAQASVVDGSTAMFTGAQGRTDYLVISSNSTTVWFDDIYTVTPGPGCYNSPGDHTIAMCFPQAVSAVLVYVNDGDDIVKIRTSSHVTDVTVLGGAGNDWLVNEPSYDSHLAVKLFGGIGDDNLQDKLVGNHSPRLDGGDGNDNLFCSNLAYPGNSMMVGGSGADTFAGGCLADYSFRFTPVNVTIDGIADDGAPGEGDNVKTSVAGVRGGSGSDVLSSTVAAWLFGGKAGTDLLIGSNFNDIIMAKDGAADDTVIGGGGYDSCQWDAGDNVSGCE